MGEPETREQFSQTGWNSSRQVPRKREGDRGKVATKQYVQKYERYWIHIRTVHKSCFPSGCARGEDTMPDRLPNSQFPHSSRNVLQPPAQHANGQRPRGGVGQDKTAPECVRFASIQPVTPKNLARPCRMESNSPRSQNRFTSYETLLKSLPKISCLSGCPVGTIEF